MTWLMVAILAASGFASAFNATMALVALGQDAVIISLSHGASTSLLYDDAGKAVIWTLTSVGQFALAFWWLIQALKAAQGKNDADQS